MSKEAWQEYIEEISGRADSLKPPYPTFAEFLRGLLRLRSGAAVAKMIGVEEKTINAWTADGAKPNQRLKGKIAEAFGYRFGERVFYEAVISMQPTPDNLGSTRSLETLRTYLKALREQVRVSELAKLFGFPTVSILSEFTTGQLALTSGSITRILQTLPEVARHITGEVLSPLTPMSIVVNLAEDCRMRLGLGRPEFAKRLGLTHEYYNFFVGRAETSGASSGYMQVRDVYVALLAQLSAIRAELTTGSGTTGTSYDDRDELAPPVPAASAEASGDRNFDELVREMFGAHSEIQAIRRDQQILTARLDAALSRLEQLRQRLAPDSASFMEESVAVTEVELGAAPVKVEEPYRSPLSPERWKEHTLPVDAMLIRTTKRQIEGTGELLGLLAEMQDDESRAAVRRELDDHITELLIVLDAFSQAHPGTKVATLYASWRRFKQELGVQGAEAPGRDGNGKRKKEGT